MPASPVISPGDSISSGVPQRQPFRRALSRIAPAVSSATLRHGSCPLCTSSSRLPMSPWQAAQAAFTYS